MVIEARDNPLRLEGNTKTKIYSIVFYLIMFYSILLIEQHCLRYSDLNGLIAYEGIVLSLSRDIMEVIVEFYQEESIVNRQQCTF